MPRGIPKTGKRWSTKAKKDVSRLPKWAQEMIAGANNGAGIPLDRAQVRMDLTVTCPLDGRDALLDSLRELGADLTVREQTIIPVS